MADWFLLFLFHVHLVTDVTIHQQNSNTPEEHRPPPLSLPHPMIEAIVVTEFWPMAHFWMSYGRCTMPGSPMGRSEGLTRCWTGQVLP